MRYLFLLIFIFSALFLFVTCDEDGQDGLSYGLCKKGERRCTGTKLEICNDYEEWILIADCADSDGECIYEKGDYYCTEEIEETPDTIVEWEDEEEVADDGGSQLLDNFGPSTDDDVDDSDLSDQSDQSDESEVSDETLDEDIDDSDSDDLDEDSVDDDIVPVCGNGVLEGDEICEKNDVKDCVEIDSEKFTAGKAICDDTCMDYNTVTCVE